MRRRQVDPAVKVCGFCLRASCWHGVRICDFAVTAEPVMKSLSELAALAFEDPSYWNIPSEAPINAQLPRPNQKVAGLTITSLLMWMLRGNKNISEAVTKRQNRTCIMA